MKLWFLTKSISNFLVFAKIKVSFPRTLVTSRGQTNQDIGLATPEKLFSIKFWTFLAFTRHLLTNFNLWPPGPIRSTLLIRKGQNSQFNCIKRSKHVSGSLVNISTKFLGNRTYLSFDPKKPRKYPVSVSRVKKIIQNQFYEILHVFLRIYSGFCVPVSSDY